MALGWTRGVSSIAGPAEVDDPTEAARLGPVSKQAIADTGALTRKCMEVVEDDLLAWDGEQPRAAPSVSPKRPWTSLRSLPPGWSDARPRGERDMAFHYQAQRPTAGLPWMTFVSLPGIGHGEAIARSGLALPHIQRFLADRAP